MRFLCATVVVAAMTVAAPMQVLASGAATTPASAPDAVSITSAADRAVRTATLEVQRSDVPVPRPYQGRDRSRKQMGGGGSKTGMVIGVVSMLAGTAATVYMVKAMKDSNERASAAAQ